MSPSTPGSIARMKSHDGFSLLEVLVSLLILCIGLLGLAGLQTKANMLEMEAYQRSIALQLVKDMASRVSSSREFLDALEDATDEGAVFGANTSLAEGACDSPGTAALRQVCEWHAALTGAAATVGAASIGAPIGMRGCVIEDTQSTTALREFVVVGVWQGITPTASPPDGFPGAECDPLEDFGGTGLRRAIVTRVLIPRLAAE